MNWEVIDMISAITHTPANDIEFVLAPSAEIEAAIYRYYGNKNV